MTKTEFFEKIKIPTNTILFVSTTYGAPEPFFKLVPSYDMMAPELSEAIYLKKSAGIEIAMLTQSPYTRANLDHIRNHIANAAPYVAEWRRIQAAYRRTSEYRDRRRERKIYNTAKAAGLLSGYKMGDDYMLNIQDHVHRRRDMDKYHANGEFLALVEQERTRTYAKSSQWRPSKRVDKFLVGTNESGTRSAKSEG